jgi:hypothetical protein
MEAQKLSIGTNLSPVLCPFLPNVGTGSHTLRKFFVGNRTQFS